MSDLQLVCERAVKTGGNVLIQCAGHVTWRAKGTRDFVTDADVRSQAAIIEMIRSQCDPNDVIVAEEASEVFETDFSRADEFSSHEAATPKTSAHTWYVDPLDGTTNYMHGFPHYCVSVAVVRDDRILAGAVYDPYHDELFSAAVAEGATLNGQPIRVAKTRQLQDALLASSLPTHSIRSSAALERFVRGCEAARSTRRTGSAALNLCYVACGRLDGYFAATLNSWDSAAGALLINEAGGRVTDLTGRPFQVNRAEILATCSNELSRALQELFE